MQRCTKVTDAGIASVASAGQLRILSANKLHEIGTLTIKALIATCRWINHNFAPKESAVLPEVCTSNNCRVRTDGNCLFLMAALQLALIVNFFPQRQGG